MKLKNYGNSVNEFTKQAIPESYCSWSRIDLDHSKQQTFRSWSVVKTMRHIRDKHSRRHSGHLQDGNDYVYNFPFATNIDQPANSSILEPRIQRSISIFFPCCRSCSAQGTCRENVRLHRYSIFLLRTECKQTHQKGIDPRKATFLAPIVWQTVDQSKRKPQNKNSSSFMSNVENPTKNPQKTAF